MAIDSVFVAEAVTSEADPEACSEARYSASISAATVGSSRRRSKLKNKLGNSSSLRKVQRDIVRKRLNDPDHLEKRK